MSPDLQSPALGPETGCTSQISPASSRRQDAASEAGELPPEAVEPEAAPTDLLPLLPAALKSSPSKKGRGTLLAVKPLGPTAAFSASQIPSEREDAQYDLRGARSYPTLEDEGDLPASSLGAQETSP